MFDSTTRPYLRAEICNICLNNYEPALHYEVKISVCVEEDRGPGDLRRPEVLDLCIECEQIVIKYEC